MHKTAIDSQNIEAQVNAQQQIAELAMESARLRAIKASQEMNQLNKKRLTLHLNKLFKILQLTLKLKNGHLKIVGSVMILQ